MFPSKGKEAKQNWFLRMNPRRVETQQKRSWKEQGRGRNKRNKAPLGRTVVDFVKQPENYEMGDASVRCRCMKSMRTLFVLRSVLIKKDIRLTCFDFCFMSAWHRSRTSSNASHFHPVSTNEHQPHFRRRNSIRLRCTHYRPVSDSN